MKRKRKTYVEIYGAGREESNCLFISWKQHADEKISCTRKNSIDTDVFIILIQKARLNIFQVVSIR